MRFSGILCFVLAAASLGGEPHAEFVYETAPFPSCHASTILETKDGEFLAAWFGGSREGAADVAIWMSRRGVRGWSEPVEMARHEGVPTWNPVLFRSADGVTWLYYKFGPSPREWTGAFRRSEDDGRTWSESEQMPAGLLGPIRNKPLLLPDGTLVSGSSVESHQAWTSWVEISGDQGRSWSLHGPVLHPEQPFGLIQPAIVPVTGGLRMFLRARGVGKICYADSFDGGRNWSHARELDLPHPNSGIDAVRLRDGRVVLVYNHTERGRSPLNLAVSHDEGLTWERFLDLETDPGEYSYPAIIQASDGGIHVTYTWRRERIKYVAVPLASVP